MKDVYLYFRRHSTLSEDNDMSNGSVCIPSSAISGIEFSSNSGVNSMQIYFRSILNNFGMDAATNGTISDYALLRLDTGDGMNNEAILEDFLNQLDQRKRSIRVEDKFWVVLDAVTGEKAHDDFTQVTTSVDAVHA